MNLTTSDGRLLMLAASDESMSIPLVPVGNNAHPKFVAGSATQALSAAVTLIEATPTLPAIVPSMVVEASIPFA